MRKQVFGVVLVMFLSLLMSISVLAETDTQYNLSATITTDRETYEKSDKIEIELELKNENLLRDISSLKVTEITPNGWKIRNESELDADVLKAGDSVTVTLVADNVGYIGTVILIGAIAIILIICFYAWILKLDKKKRSRIVATVMVMLLLSGYYSPMLVQAEGEKVEQEVCKTIKIKGQEVSLGVKLTYVIEEPEMPVMTTDEITLKMYTWEEPAIYEVLYEEWQKTYPNIEIEFYYNDMGISSSVSPFAGKWGTSEGPDIYLSTGTQEYFIENDIALDLTDLWNADPDTKHIIGGINEFGLGCMGTDSRWAIPVNFYPVVAWVNMGYLKNANVEMPKTDWTFEEMKTLVEELTMENENGWGLSEVVSIITWYPIASDPDCIGEFGWDGEDFDLTSWAEAVSIEKELRDAGVIAPVTMPGTIDKYPQEEGKVAVRFGNWWAWEKYWNQSEMYEKGIYWVPYALPHTEENKDSTTNFATMDFGGISSSCKYPREAYEALKFFCWGGDGWRYRLAHYDEIVAATMDEEYISYLNRLPLESCPITLDEQVWETYIAMHPASADSDRIGKDVGIDRTQYFNTFFEYVRETNWTCYNHQKVAGFGKWWAEEYQSATKYGNYYSVEEAVLVGGKNPDDYVKDLTESANRIHRETMEVLKTK